MSKKQKKKRITTRERDWESKHETAYSRDLAKHRRGLPSVRPEVAQADPLPTGVTPNATVISHSKKWALVQRDGSERLCTIDERLVEADETLVAPGDFVYVEEDADTSVIRGIGPRRTTLSRPGGPHARVKQQVLAANLDLLIIVAAAKQPPLRTGLIDRFLIAAQLGGVEPVLCVNKMDLVEAPPPEIEEYRALGMRCYPISCVTGQGLSAFRQALVGKTSVLAGHSGVGKTSLLNALDPALALETQETTSNERGRHTTTGGRLYELPEGIRIIDTPGIRALGVWGVTPEEVAYYFPELARVATDCRFRNCTHTHEPGCAVLEAIEAGAVSKLRYESYLRLRASLESETGTTPGRLTAKYQGQK